MEKIKWILLQVVDICFAVGDRFLLGSPLIDYIREFNDQVISHWSTKRRIRQE